MENSPAHDSSPKPSRISPVSISLPILAGVVVLALLLSVANALLVARNRSLQRKLEGVMMSTFAPVGSTFSEMSGRKPDGTPVDIDLAQSAPLVLLVFEPTCEVCEENWANWAKLISDPQVGRQCLLISAYPNIPPSYLESHHAAQRNAILGINPEIARSFHLLATPQTILVQKGRIVKTWPSVLSEADLKEIKTGLIDLSEANP
jgi:hypothetical protein